MDENIEDHISSMFINLLSQTDASSSRLTWANNFTRVALYCEMFACFTFNLMSVFCIVSNKNSLQISINVLILNLAVADVMYASLIPFYASQFALDDQKPSSVTQLTCRLSFFLDVTCMIVIGFSIATLTLERYLFLKKKFIISEQLLRKRTSLFIFYIMMLWIFAMLFSAIKSKSIILVYHEETNVHTCGSTMTYKADLFYTFVKYALAFIIPFTMIITFCFLLIRLLKKLDKSQPNFEHTTSLNALTISNQSIGNRETEMIALNLSVVDPNLLNQSSQMPKNSTFELSKKRKRRSTRLVLAIAVSFLICWLPMWLFNFLMMLSEYDSIFVRILRNFTFFLVYMNGVLNPFIYMILTENFKFFCEKIFKSTRSIFF
jgi:hypothetical protein